MASAFWMRQSLPNGLILPPYSVQVCRLKVDTPTSGAQSYLVLDGAHTPESATAFAQTLRRYFPDAPVALVLASDKDHKAVMEALHQTLEPDVVLFTSVPVAGAEDRCDSDGRLKICANATNVWEMSTCHSLQCWRLTTQSSAPHILG